MPLVARIQHHYQAAQAVMEAASELLPEPIARGAELVTECFMREGRVLVCGVGAAGRIGRHLAAVLTDRLIHDRPGLAAIHLDGHGLGDDDDPALGAARQLEAIAHPGDVLVALSLYGEGAATCAAARAARERGLRLVAVCGGSGGALAEMLGEEDVLLCVPGDDAPRILEGQLMAVHSLAACIDYLLLGA